MGGLAPYENPPKALCCGGRAAALMALKKKKMYETQLEQCENNILRVNEQQMMLENQRTTVETVTALRDAAHASKSTMSEMKITDVDQVRPGCRPRLERVAADAACPGSLGDSMAIRALPGHACNMGIAGVCEAVPVVQWGSASGACPLTCPAHTFLMLGRVQTVLIQ